MNTDEAQTYDPTESSEPGSRAKIKAQALALNIGLLKTSRNPVAVDRYLQNV